MTFGLTATGFVRKTEVDLFDEIVAEARALINPSLDASPASPDGQQFGIFARKQAEMWEVTEAVLNGWGANASGRMLDFVCELTGTKRHGATFSAVTAQVTLAASTTKLAGSIIATVDGNADARFVSVADAVNAGGSPAVVNVLMQSDTAGPVEALAGTLTELEGVISGVTAITNAVDADQGELVEQDRPLRLRRKEEVAQSGSTTVGAMRARVRAVEGVSIAQVYTNRTGDVVEDRPAHSFEVLALGGGDDDLAQVIWDSMPLGIEAYSHTDDSGIAIDDEGNENIVGFSRPSARRIYVQITIEVDDDLYAGDDAVAVAIAGFSDGSLELTTTNGSVITGQVALGGTVYRSSQSLAALTVAGVTGVTLVELSVDSEFYDDADIDLGAREYLGQDASSLGISSGDVTVVVV